MTRFCKFPFGKSLILKGKPESRTYNKSFLFHNSLYDSNVKLIKSSSYAVGETLDGVFNSRIYAPETPILNSFSNEIIDNSFWLGYFHAHYGHFLLSTLQRLWKIDQKKDFIIAPSFDESLINNLDYIGIILDALEIDVNKIISPSSGCELRNITVNQSSFVENYFCYPMWGDFMRGISKKIISDNCGSLSETPVYISRSRMKSGTRFFEGEECVSETLKKFGIETVYVEEMSFKEQLDFWNRNKIFIGFSGSSFITSSFFGNKKLIILHHDDYVFGSQLMVDVSSNNKTAYINVENFISRNLEKENVFKIINCEAIISDIINSIRIMGN
ncbi:glycosyltransferase family 61 protein [Gluconobacter roseus]|uniref:Glycosyltransferase 61 catalytic domain-containing protein n=1 Tax=Gluconobacter roseus NBRC 3990 TaxID=1307950 RepID=A0A4Y3MA74_9PROT|nr:glycosyltransferase 61 family protein [Gluconobacter roseus]GEB03229.1 hypothetical protein GRO01_08050 [Gluconobacter roseus NBRC 3990]GLP93687.1 hypothetical protein GCM10007871_16650 [Gluconobacter roseus NBRC 3990]